MDGFAHTLCLEKQLQEYPILMLISSLEIEGLRQWLSGKESSFQCRRLGLDLKSQGDPLRRKWQPTPVSLPGKSHGQKSLVGYSARGCKELDTTEQLNQQQQKERAVFTVASKTQTARVQPRWSSNRDSQQQSTQKLSTVCDGKII